jgi:hypothetical protein
MRGHLTERRPGVWRITVSDGFDDAGRRRRVTRTVTGTKTDAERELTKMLSERDGGTLADGRQPLSVYLIDEWLVDVSAVSKRGRPLAPTTRQRYADAVDHVTRVIGRVRLMDLRTSHVVKLRDRLLAEGTLAPQSVADVLRVLSQSLGRAEAKGYVGKNVASAQLVNRPVGDRPSFDVIDASVASKILEEVQGTGPVGRRRPPRSRARAPTRRSVGVALGCSGRRRTRSTDADLRRRRDPLRPSEVGSRRAGPTDPRLRGEGAPASPRRAGRAVVDDRTAARACRRQRDRGALAPGVVLNWLASVRGGTRVRRDRLPHAQTRARHALTRQRRLGCCGDQADGPRRLEDPAPVPGGSSTNSSVTPRPG